MAQPIDNLDLPFDERLRIYRFNRQAAQTELMRVKAMYAQEYISGASLSRLEQISQWAKQVRAAAGIPENDATYGNNQYVSGQLQDALNNVANRPSSGGGGLTGFQGLASNADSVVTLGIGVLALFFVGSLFSRK